MLPRRASRKAVAITIEYCIDCPTVCGTCILARKYVDALLVMTAIEKLETELALVEAAITAAYSGAEYEVESGKSRRRLKRQSLDSLLKRKAQLELSISRLDPCRVSSVRHGVPER